jgi:hypothetical protein
MRVSGAGISTTGDLGWEFLHPPVNTAPGAPPGAAQRAAVADDFSCQTEVRHLTGSGMRWRCLAQIIDGAVAAQAIRLPTLTDQEAL